MAFSKNFILSLTDIFWGAAEGDEALAVAVLVVEAVIFPDTVVTVDVLVVGPLTA